MLKKFTKDEPKKGCSSNSEFYQGLYMSSFNFWSDLNELAHLIDHKMPADEKKAFIKKGLKKMNAGLPSLIFIPSSSNKSLIIKSH